eukprot:jgi/Chlat1/3807/Chrsp259S03931
MGMGTGTGMGMGTGIGENAPTIIFDACKKETHTPNAGLKQLARRLRNTLKLQINKDELSLERLREGRIVVFGGPREKCTVDEFAAINAYIQGGGSVLILLGEGGEARLNTNFNYLMEEYGIMISSVYTKYPHPKEVLIDDGVLNRAVLTAQKPSDASLEFNDPRDGIPNSGLAIAYPYGATLGAQAPAVAILGSGTLAFPSSRPIVAVWQARGPKGGNVGAGAGVGRVMVAGSACMFEDAWLEREDNARFADWAFRWLLGDPSIHVSAADADDVDTPEFQYVPDIEALAERPRLCLQEGEAIPIDFMTMLDDTLFEFTTDLIPEAVELYGKLDVKHAPLTLIPPQFEVPVPALAPAVFPPAFREPPAPALDLFDLDDALAGDGTRLAALLNKCREGTAEDVDFFVRESGSVLGISEKVLAARGVGVGTGAMTTVDPKSILSYVLQTIVNCRRVNPMPPGHVRL